MFRKQFVHATNVLRHAFIHQNPCLAYHEERVAYILFKLLEHHNGYTQKEKQDIFLLGLLHEIGTYAASKTNHMLPFEEQDPMDDSIFGYLLLKTFSPLADYADCLLYQQNHKARYYSVPFSQKHLKIAKLLYLADCIDTCLMEEGADAVKAFLQEPVIQSVFSQKEIALFWENDRKMEILKHLASHSYQKEVADYIQRQLVLTEDEIRAYFVTYLFSAHFQNEASAIHTGYTLLLSEQLAQNLHLTEPSCKMARLAAMEHCVIMSPPSSEIRSSFDFDRYLKELYQRSDAKSAHRSLSEHMDGQVLFAIDQSFCLLECLIHNRPVTFSPVPAAETVVLSYYVSSSKNYSQNACRFTKEQLFTYLSQKYQACGLEDSVLRALAKSYDTIVSHAQSDTESTKAKHRQMMHEMHALQVTLPHYNRKYSA